MTWAAGGTPEGTAASTAAIRPVVAPVQPDVALVMPAPFILESGREAADHELFAKCQAFTPEFKQNRQCCQLSDSQFNPLMGQSLSPTFLEEVLAANVNAGKL